MGSQAPRTITIPASAIVNKGYCLSTEHVLVMPARLPHGSRCSIGAIARGESGRKVFQGPMVPGPWAWASPRAIVIAANPNMGTAAEAERNRAAGIEHDVEEGDLVVFDDVEYRVRFTDNFGQSRGYIDRIALDLVRDLRTEDYSDERECAGCGVRVRNHEDTCSDSCAERAAERDHRRRQRDAY